MKSRFDDQQPVDQRIDSAFWANVPLAELAKEQGIEPCVDPSELAGDWPPEESIDDFLSFVREVRR